MKATLKTLCGATREIEIDTIAPEFLMPMRVGPPARGITFKASDDAPSLNAPLAVKTVTRRFVYDRSGSSTTPLYKEAYEGPGQDKSHVWQDDFARVSCAEFEKRAGDVWQKRNKQIADIGYALGVLKADECPLIDDAINSALAEIAKLKDKAAKWDAYERTQQELLDKQVYGKGKLYGIEATDHDRWKSETITTQPITKEVIERGIAKMAKRGGTYSPPPTIPLIMDAPREQGPGLRDGSGKYTEPGEPIIYCDHGWDD